ncbi:MAG: tRNA (adenosine(37)-N6)-threonylcarbamoyltransferase complex ATPase subunit type 1 TsaE [Candidatus Puniceispirillum sp.]|nr:tRNA (adenosine(37)-N6)-threonylcarbamoyltransferase complex ATPase subunit type 1 TsaE [Candidatus Puniceispirillum sp.]
MAVLKLDVQNLAATERLGQFLSQELAAGDVIALQGPLGAGKSALARAMISKLCPHEADIPSPTFTLVQTYDMPDGTPLWHLDLYRIDTPEDAIELGIEDAFLDAVCLIEWPERLGTLLPDSCLSIHINPVGDALDSQMRQVEINAPARWDNRMSALAKLFDKPDA